MTKILSEVPTHIYTDRLLLRIPQRNDGKVMNLAIRESIQELKPWLPFVQTLPLQEETELNLESAHDKFLKKESFRFLIFTKETGEFVGVTSLQSIDWDIPKCEIGYWANSKYVGNGYMTEAVDAITKLGIHTLRFKRIEIRCESENIKSRAIPERLHFTLEGILKNEDLSADGKRVTDTCIYAVTQH